MCLCASFQLLSLHWFDEIIELLYAYLVFYGAAALWISHEHFGVGDWIEKRIKNIRIRYVYRMIIELLVLCFVVIFFYYSLRLTILARDVTNVFAIPETDFILLSAGFRRCHDDLFDPKYCR